MATTTLRKSNTNLCIFTILSMQEILKKIQRAKHKLSAFLKSIKPKNKKNISEIQINSEIPTSIKYKMTGT